MLNLFKKTHQGETIKLTITDMHCTSCAITIDYELEGCEGVVNSDTNYARSETTVTYNPKIISLEKIISTIKKAGYTASITNI